jgi:hypothetical protein
VISKIQTRQRRITVVENVQERNAKDIPSGILAILIDWFLPLISGKTKADTVLTLRHEKRDV